ncbi:hypothetical protein COO20_24050 [Thalassospira marina]|uniref:DUF4269 domain-containing protein n=1 Tax=Thalassospira marina TaxID=2048283 RepID=A0A2N3KDA4_9PROT|nr:hypothetical protein COO20_24050 [Thalassospira marina]
MGQDWQAGLQVQDFTGLQGLHRPQAGARGANCAASLQESGIWQALSAFGPAVAGTIPLGLDLPGSDIDILLEVSDTQRFTAFCDQNFAGLDGYQRHDRAATANVGAAVVVQFMLPAGQYPAEEVELFATNRPVMDQYGFRHMVVEARLIWLCGDAFAQQVRALKKAGLKTEPAFATLLGIPGDPYLGLDALFGLSPSQLEHWLVGRL